MRHISSESASFLVWRHVTQEQVQALRGQNPAPGAPIPLSPGLGGGCGISWHLLHGLAVSGEEGLDERQQAVLVDLYGGVLRQGEAWGFSNAKLSVLLGLFKEVHSKSVRDRLALEGSFRVFREGLLSHSVQR